MTIKFCAGDVPPVDLLAATQELYDASAQDLIRAISAVKAGRHDEAKAAAQAVRDLKTAFQMVMEERTRVDKLRKQVAGTVGTGTLDLRAARDEIGRRLACLRDAG